MKRKKITKNETMVIRVDAAIKNRLEELSYIENKTPSKIVRELLSSNLFSNYPTIKLLEENLYYGRSVSMQMCLSACLLIVVYDDIPVESNSLICACEEYIALSLEEDSNDKFLTSIMEDIEDMSKAHPDFYNFFYEIGQSLTDCSFKHVIFKIVELAHRNWHEFKDSKPLYRLLFKSIGFFSTEAEEISIDSLLFDYARKSVKEIEFYIEETHDLPKDCLVFNPERLRRLIFIK